MRKALFLAVDRQQVVDVIWNGYGRMVGPVGGGVKLWALPQEELERLPGYRQDRAGREQDIAEARALYEAAGRPELPEAWFSDIPAYIPAFASTFVETLRKNLGVELPTRTQPYTRIWEGLLRDCSLAAMTWSFDNGWIDLDDWLYPYFHSTGNRNSFKVSDPELDRLLEAQRREFDFERRRDLGYEIQRYLLGAKGDKPGSYLRLDYGASISMGVGWPYMKNRLSWAMSFGITHWYANVWFDRNDPSWQGRPD